MAVLWAIIAYVVLLPFIALGLCVGAVLVCGKPTKAKPAPAPRARKSTPAPVAPPAPEPMPDYIPRWNRARILREWEELARFQRLLNEAEPAPKDPYQKLRDRLGSL